MRADAGVREDKIFEFMKGLTRRLLKRCHLRGAILAQRRARPRTPTEQERAGFYLAPECRCCRTFPKIYARSSVSSFGESHLNDGSERSPTKKVVLGTYTRRRCTPFMFDNICGHFWYDLLY
jgi:hypothetical protein